MRLACTVLVVSGCVAVVGEPEEPMFGDHGGVGSLPEDDVTCAPVSRNDEIRLALTPHCKGCHTVGSRPFFASLEAFDNGLAYNERYVVRGDPERSLLVQLLRGTAPGTYTQMPPVTSYATLADTGVATLPLAAIEQWIRELPPAPASLEQPAPESFTVRRLTAEEMVLGLMDQLGLAVTDFVHQIEGWQQKPWFARYGTVFVWPGDWAPGVNQGYGSDGRATERFEALGGPSTLFYRKRDRQLTPGGVQVLVQMSQAWCSLALSKPGNTAVLGDLSLATTSQSDAAAIRTAIRRLYLRMLGALPSEAELDEIYGQLYLPLEPQGTKVAWTAVCASFVRHPLWLAY